MSDKDSGSAVYNILAFSFAGQDTAAQTMKEIKSSGALDGYEIAAQATIDQDAKGKVHIHEPGKGGVGATVGAVAGGLLGLIGGPAGVLAMATAGAAVGGTAGHYWGRAIPKEDLEELGEALTPNSSMMLLLLEDTYSEGVINSMAGYSGDAVTLTVVTISQGRSRSIPKALSRTRQAMWWRVKAPSSRTRLVMLRPPRMLPQPAPTIHRPAAMLLRQRQAASSRQGSAPIADWALCHPVPVSQTPAAGNAAWLTGIVDPNVKTTKRRK